MALTDPISRQNIVDRFADYVRATANAGISWGTNAYPFGEWTHGYLFGGDTNGKPSGGHRQLEYKLEPGEACWLLKIKRSVDFT